MKLPTDNVMMPVEERDNFLMLFPDEKSPAQDMAVPSQPQQNTMENTSASVQNRHEKNTQKLKKEVLSLSLFIVVFFILNLPYVKKLIVEYIPMCGKSWIATHLVQAVLFAFILWIVINSEYSRV
jgi:hypothetical protein